MGLVQAMFELHLIGVRFQVSLSLKKMTDEKVWKKDKNNICAITSQSYIDIESSNCLLHSFYPASKCILYQDFKKDETIPYKYKISSLIT